jgi:L-alanine-DL-glutamate epimerase-like enolase superfamily enzyme
MPQPEIRIAEIAHESWPLANPFVIARGAKTAADVVVVHVSDGTHIGRGEAVPYARYGETIDGTLASLRALDGPVDRAAVQRRLPPGAARNALDCALWDLEAKRARKRAWDLASLPAPAPVMTAYTLSVGRPAEMAAAAQAVPHLKLLKVKLAGAGDPERMSAVRRARPDARLIADANEAWTPDMLGSFLDAAAFAGFELVEQPLPAGADEALSLHQRPVPVCADESAHTSGDLERLAGRYDAVNIKLDKTGGLTEALAFAKAARVAGLRTMVGSMVATSLAAAPALLLAAGADWVDLDGPLLLAKDRDPGLAIADGWISPPPAALWG